jgi:hypothetical protein
MADDVVMYSVVALGYEDTYGKERRLAQYAVYVTLHKFLRVVRVIQGEC